MSRTKRLPRAPHNNRWRGWRTEIHRADGKPLTTSRKSEDETADFIAIARKSHRRNRPCDEVRIDVIDVKWPSDAHRSLIDHLRVIEGLEPPPERTSREGRS